MTTHTVQSPDEFARACEHVQPGETIEVLPGLYDRATILKGKDARAAAITIRAGARGPISGGQKPDYQWGVNFECKEVPPQPTFEERWESLPSVSSPPKPRATDFAFLILDDCHNIVIDGLEIQDCWPTIFFLTDSSRITIRNCRLKHGIYAIFARGKADKGDDRTRVYVVEGNHWQQDTSADHKLWSFHDWARAHGGEGADGLYRYFNGAFFGGKTIAGDVVIRGNRVSDAYNVIRIKGAGTGEAPGELARVNANVHIFDNDFIRIRDNPIEPEVYALDWHVRHNRLFDCHAWFSVDGVAGGYWYFYGNTGWFMTRQGLPSQTAHTMGRVLKLSYEIFNDHESPSSVPSAPWYVFNNSWYLRCPIIGGSDANAVGATESPDFTAELSFFNNAMQWCDPDAHRESVCELTDLVMNFDWQRSRGVTFDHDICSRGDFKRFFAPPGSIGEPYGIVAMHPLFRDGRAGDFTLGPESEALGSGLVKRLASSGGTPADIRPGAENLLNMGAFQDYGRTSVPALEAEAEKILADPAAPAV